MGTRDQPSEKRSLSSRPKVGSLPTRLRYEGAHALPGRPPLEVWTILEGPATGASFSLHPEIQDICTVTRQTILRFLPPPPPPRRPSGDKPATPGPSPHPHR